MRTDRLPRCMALARIALVVLVGVLSGGPSTWAQEEGADPCVAGQPCFSNVSDILNGRRHLLRTDDLVTGVQLTGGSFAGDLLLTADSQVTTRNVGSLTGQNLPTGTNATVTRARMFDTPYDVAVSAVFELPLPVPGQLHWWLEGSPGLLASGATQITISIPALLLSAAGDFTGDGYDDLIFFTQDSGDGTSLGAIVATAVDPTDASKGLKFGPEANFGGIISAVNPVNPLAITVATPIATPEVLTVGGFNGPGCSGPYCGLAIQAFTVDPTTLAITSHTKSA